MYVQWKARQHRGRVRCYGRAAPAPPYWSAVLVESVRVEIDGVRRPRQRILAYLGAIAEDALRHVWPRTRFWQGVDARLGALELAAACRARLEGQLAARVPRPTTEEVAESGRLLASLETRLGRPRP